MALAEMYVQGASTRKVAAITEELCGYEQPASRLADWLEKNVPQGLTVFAFPSAHRRRIRTTNGLERISREIRRRTGMTQTRVSVAATAAKKLMRAGSRLAVIGAVFIFLGVLLLVFG